MPETLSPAVPVPVADLLTEAGLHRKILVVPSPQAGRKIIAAWARKGLPTIGLRAYTPGKLAEVVLEEAFPDRTLNRLPDLNQVLGLDEILRRFDFRKLEALGWSGQQLAKSIRAMRLSGLSPNEYKSAIPRKLGREVSLIFDAYLKWLYGGSAIDEAERFVQAEFALGRTKSPALLAVMGETPISEAARGFLQGLATKSAHAVVVGIERETAAGTAGQAFEEWDLALPPVSPAAKLDLVRLPAVEDEARFAFEEIERRGLPLDSVELAYPRHTPYLPMLQSEASRRGVAVTSAAGTPLSDLPVGQAVRLFLEWLASGQDSIELVRLLRSGFVKLPDSVPPRNVIANLIEVHVSGERKAYRRAFQGLKKAAQEEMEQAKGTERERVSKLRVKRIRDAERAVDRLFDYVPAPDDTLHGFVSRVRRFVEGLVPESVNPESTAAKGRAELISRLAQIEEGPDSSHPAAHLVGRLRDWLPTVIVHARVDAPGAAHIVPLESAGLTGRDHLFILGLDSGSFLPSPVEDVFLPDDFCEAYDRISGPLSSEERVERRRLALRRALARAGQTATVVVAEGRIADDSDAGPASMFIELEAEHGDARSVRLAPASGLVQAIVANRDDPIAHELLDRHFLGMSRGRVAMAARASAEFTDHDAFIGPRATVDSILDAPLSPSRLQVLATCPFQFFQSQVLKIPKLEERKRGQWMSALENGSLVHDALSGFNREVMAGTTDARDSAALEKLLVDAYKGFRKGNEPPSEFAWRAKLRELVRVAKVVTGQEREIMTAELGFGVAPWRTESEADHTGDFSLKLGEVGLLLRGRIDVVERTARGIVVTDYKTGRSDQYNEQDLLDGGKRLQWVLYAYAYEELTGEQVEESGYLFVSGDAAGQTAYGQPASREEVGALLGAQFGLARRGAFGASVDPNGHCKWCDFRRVCGDLRQRRSEIANKLDEILAGDPGGDGQAGADPAAAFSGWTHAEKHIARRRK